MTTDTLKEYLRIITMYPDRAVDFLLQINKFININRRDIVDKSKTQRIKTKKKKYFRRHIYYGR